jgi:predicted RNase H-like nuclease (RuvC/YqgF family)
MMLRTSSRSCHLRIFLATLAMLLCATLAAYAQSLGDVARENREQKAADAPTTPPKVITNKTLPKDPDAGATPSAGESQPQTAPPPASAESSKKAARQRAAEQRAAEQWKQKILAQENTIANLRLRIDRLKASIHFLDENTTYDYYAGVEHNRYQARKLERLAQMQQQLDQQKKKLEDMQEAARHAGMHTAVYDP